MNDCGLPDWWYENDWSTTPREYVHKYRGDYTFADAVEFFGLRVGRRNARMIMVECVYHREKTPSLCLWANGRFNCFGCQVMGDVLDLVAHLIDTPRLEVELWRYCPVPPEQLPLFDVLPEAPRPVPCRRWTYMNRPLWWSYYGREEFAPFILEDADGAEAGEGGVGPQGRAEGGEAGDPV